MPDTIHGMVRWKALAGILVTIFAILFNYSYQSSSYFTVRMEKLEDKIVAPKEWDQAEKYRSQFLSEYREDQKTQNLLLRELLQKITHLETRNISRSKNR